MAQESRLASTFHLAGQSAVYFIGYLFTFVVGFGFQIYLAKQLGAVGLGVYGLVDSAVQTIAGLVGLGVAQTVARFLPQHLARNEYAVVRRMLGLAASVLLGAGAIGYGVMAAALPWIGDWWPEAAEIRQLILVVGLTLPLGLLMFFSMQALRGFHDIRYMVLGNSFLQLSAKVALTVLFLGLGWGLMGYAWAVVIATALALAWMIAGLSRHVKRLDPAESRDTETDPVPYWIGYARVMYAGSLLAVVAAPVDKFLVGHFAGSAAVGVLLVALTLQQLSGAFLQMFIVVIGPMFAGANATGDRSTVVRLYHQCTDWLVRLSLPLVIFLFVFAEPVLALYGEEFARSGTTVLWILLIGQSVNLATGPIGNLLNMTGGEHAMLRLSVAQTVLVAGACVVLIPATGLNGAAAAAVLGLVTMNLAAILLARKRLDLQWWDTRYWRWILPALVTVAVAVTVRLYWPEVGILGLLAVLLLLGGAFHGAYLAQGLHSDDREFMAAVWKRLGFI